MGAGGRPCPTFAGSALDRVANQDPYGWVMRGMDAGRPCPLLASGGGWVGKGGRLWVGRRMGAVRLCSALARVALKYEDCIWAVVEPGPPRIWNPR